MSARATAIQAIRGMNDVLPDEAPYWHKIEETLHHLAKQYGYSEIRFPILEKTQLFSRTIGEVTDIVEKEMYTFDDRNGESLTLRPEGTAGCVRAGIEQGLLYNQIQRLWYLGPMFRHERPQKGRYRQFQQFGVEAFGMGDSAIDAEHLLMCLRLWEKLGLQDVIKLEINSLGDRESRAVYRDVLVDYFKKHHDKLDEDSQRRLLTNPLRILDSKNPAMQTVIQGAPKIIHYLDDYSKKHFDRLCQLLDELNVPYQVNPKLVRGLDYYGMTVYEWVTDQLGAQGTVCAGGRYDILVEQLGGQATPACGFAVGLERLVLLLKSNQPCDNVPHIYCVLMGGAAITKGLVMAEQLRAKCPRLRIVTHLAGGGFKNQFKRADKSGARWALIMGDDEVKNDQVSLKDLREDKPQEMMTQQQLDAFLKENMEQVDD